MRYNTFLGMLFSNSPQTKIMECLCENYNNPITKDEIHQVTGVSHDIIRRHIAKLIGYNLIIKTRDDEEMRFELNQDNDTVSYMMLLQNQLVIDKIKEVMLAKGIDPIEYAKINPEEEE